MEFLQKGKRSFNNREAYVDFQSSAQTEFRKKAKEPSVISPIKSTIKNRGEASSLFFLLIRTVFGFYVDFYLRI